MGWPEVEVQCSASGERGIVIANSMHPDIVTIDLGLPDITGFEVIKGIRSFSNVPIIVLTVREEEISIVKALTIGADEYVVKPFGQMELIARIRAVLRRTEDTSQEPLLEYGGLSLDIPKRMLRYRDKEVILTGTECTVIEQLIRRGGLVTTRVSLAEKIWGDSFISDNAIKVYIRHLRQKIEDDPSDPKVIKTRFGIGYYLAKNK